MNSSRPEAESKYSRGHRARRAISQDPEGVWERRFERHRNTVLAAGILGAILLVVAEFAPLLQVHAAGHSHPVRSVTTGSHDSYAQVPIAVLAALLAWSAWRSGSRFALLAVGVLGLLALGITVFGDLPDAHSTGLVGSTQTGLASASSSPAIGLFLETAGGIFLILTAAGGMLLEPVPAPPAAPPRDPSASRTRSAS